MIKHEILPLKNYPQDGKYLECLVDMPFYITKGHDYDIGTSHYTKWVVHLRENCTEVLEEIFIVKVHKDLNVILKYCYNVYKKSLKLELKRIDTLIIADK